MCVTFAKEKKNEYDFRKISIPQNEIPIHFLTQSQRKYTGVSFTLIRA